MTDRLTHLNCTQCGVGLDVLGGGRVQSHVCSHCGAELDAQDDYRVISQFKDMERPHTPFDLGMTGTLWGIDFTVIGTMQWTEYYAGKSWTWVDHQIFSPTHGYAWLTVEDGFVTFVRKVRDISRPASISERKIESSENRPWVRMGGEKFLYYASGRAKPTFIEGEFNFRPTTGDLINYVTLMSDDRMLDIVETKSEREYEITTLPDQAALLSSFGVARNRTPKPTGIHPLQKIDRTLLQLFLRNLALGAALASLALGACFWTFGTTIAGTGRQPVANGIELPFTVTRDDRLTEIIIWANASNSWAWFEAELTDAESETVVEFEKGVEYYRGSDWSEGSRTAKTRLHLESGTYQLSLKMTEAKVDWTGGQRTSQVQARVRQGVTNPWWMGALALLFGLIGSAFLAQRYNHKAKRWSGSDWSDD